MNGDLAIALVILAWFVIGCAFMVIDVNDLCRRQLEQDEREELLNELWDEPPSVTLEAAQAPRGTARF